MKERWKAELDLHQNIVIPMSEGSGSGIDSFDSLKRVSLEHDVGLAEFGVLFDLVRVKVEQLSDDGDIVGLKSHGEQVRWTEGFLADGIIETCTGCVEYIRVGSGKVFDGDRTKIPKWFGVRFGFFSSTDVKYVDSDDRLSVWTLVTLGSHEG